MEIPEATGLRLWRSNRLVEDLKTGMVATAKRSVFRILAVVLGAASLGCYVLNPLPVPISCEAVTSVQLGMAVTDVENALGRPSGGKGPPWFDRPGVDEYWMYHFLDASQNPSEYDTLDAFFLDGRLVELVSMRSPGRREGYPMMARGEPTRLAYRLARDEAGRQVREYGSAFEQVFQCEPGFARPE